MWSYFLVNILIFISAISLMKFVKLSATANYLMSLFAILVWFIPYSLISGLIPGSVLAEPIIVSFTNSALAATAADISSKQVNIDFIVKMTFKILIFIGLIIFTYRLLRLHNWKRTLLSSNALMPLHSLTKQHEIPVFSTKYHLGGYLLGVLNPIIVISDKIQEKSFIDLIIAHEKQHLKRNDNLRLLILEFCSCLFWWNPLVGKMVDLNRFYIEALCDEEASKKYGKDKYINDLSSLTLFIGLHKTSQLAANIVSIETSTTSRIKLLKENRKMNFSNKLLFALSIFAMTTAISWNTLATAIPDRDNKPAHANPEEIGSLLAFDIDILYNREASGEYRTEDRHSAKLEIWSEFAEKVSFKFNDGFSFNYKATDLGDVILLELELVENINNAAVIVASPTLQVAVGKEAVIEIDNPGISRNAYRIKAIPYKQARPTE